VGYYRKFIHQFLGVSKPLTNLIKKIEKFVWTDDCPEAFNILKKKLITAPILAHPRFNHSFEVATYASAFGEGAILKQIHDSKEHVVAYSSRMLNDAEKNYSATERECLAVIFETKKFRPYLY